MKQAQILEEFNALPMEAQELVSSLVAFLGREHQRSQPSRKKKAVDLMDEKFIGLWKDRDDMLDSGAYIRNLRKNEWA
jgi:hypothetical protein